MLKNRQTKRQLFALASALFLASAINAAEQANPKTEVQKPSQDRFEMMAQKLQLTDKQKTELKPVVEKLKKNRADTLKKLDEQEEKELSIILKPEQVTHVSRYLKRSQRMSSGHESMRGNNEGMEKRKPNNGNPQKGMYPKPPARLPEKQ